jgi:hypothetical protein
MSDGPDKVPVNALLGYPVDRVAAARYVVLG